MIKDQSILLEDLLIFETIVTKT